MTFPIKICIINDAKTSFALQSSRQFFIDQLIKEDDKNIPRVSPQPKQRPFCKDQLTKEDDKNIPLVSS
jgi:hypothetical protein